jgi:hypothetical protein
VRIDPETRSPEVNGIRYYLPRPYVAVKRPFVVAGGDYLVTGSVDAKNQVIRLDTSALPAEVRRHFGWSDDQGTVSRGTLVVSKETLDSSQPHGDRSPLDQNAALPTVASGPEALDLKPSLKTSSFSPKQLDPDANAFTLTVVLVKSAPFQAITSASAAIVPIDEAKGTADSANYIKLAVQLPVSTPFAATSADGQYSATGTRAELGGGHLFGVGLLVEGTYAPAGATARQGKFLLYSTDPSLLVLGATGTKKPSSASETTSEPEQTHASFVTSGDPTTDPLKKVNDYFDVLYLPDFDEQYAIRVSGSLGKADLKVGLENGWMVENAQAEVDNTALGKFIYSNIQKVLDLGQKAAESALNPVAALPGGSALARNSAAENATVVLRIRFAEEAEPGLYPILKPAEARAEEKKAKEAHAAQAAQAQAAQAAQTAQPAQNTSPRPVDNNVMVAYPPHTVVSYNVRKLVSVELVSATPPANTVVSAKKVQPSDPMGAKINAGIKTWLNSKSWNAALISIWKEADIDADHHTIALTLNPAGSADKEKEFRAALASADVSIQLDGETFMISGK